MAHNPVALDDADIVLSEMTPLLQDRAIPQRHALAYIAWLMASARCAAEGVVDAAEARRVWEETRDLVRRYGVSPEHIARRTLLLLPSELRELPPSALGGRLPLLFERLSTQPDGATLDARMRLFARIVEEALAEAFPADAAPPDDVVHVTCSGYIAPNPVERHLASRGWLDTTVTNSYHMGCYAAFPAVRIAAGLLLSARAGLTAPKRRVEVVHTEALSLHADLLDHSPGNVVTTTLFADGFIRYAACTGASHPKGLAGLRVRAYREGLLPSSADEMTWDLSPHGFKMTLSPQVPLAIRDHVRELVTRLLAAQTTDVEALIAQAVFAVHPGGPRIVDVVQRALGLQDAQVEVSRAVLLEHGNMSSATVPYIWRRILADDATPPGTPVVSLAFGPGLTATALYCEKV